MYIHTKTHMYIHTKTHMYIHTKTHMYTQTHTHVQTSTYLVQESCFQDHSHSLLRVHTPSLSDRLHPVVAPPPPLLQWVGLLSGVSSLLVHLMVEPPLPLMACHPANSHGKTQKQNNGKIYHGCTIYSHTHPPRDTSVGWYSSIVRIIMIINIIV